MPAQTVEISHAIIVQLCAVALSRERVIVPTLGEMTRTSSETAQRIQVTLDTAKLWPGRRVAE